MMDAYEREYVELEGLPFDLNMMDMLKAVAFIQSYIEWDDEELEYTLARRVHHMHNDFLDRIVGR